MNKNAVLLVTALAFSACTVAPDKAITIVDGNEIIITAHQEGYDCTKTSVIDGGTQVYWEPGDEIKLFYGEYSSKFTSLNTEYATTASFSGVIDGFAGNNEGVMSGEKYVWGLYPYNSDAASDGNSVTTTLPSFQKGQEGSFAKNTHIAVAKSSNIDLAFYNVTTGLRFKLKNSGIKSVKIESNDEEPIAGKFKVAFEGGYPLVQEIVNGQSSVTLAAPDGGTFETGKWYYIVTLPQTLASGFKVTFNRAGSTAERSTSNSVAITRGTFLSIDSIDEGVEFQESITSVDLGLSVKWADRNVGAESAGEYGDYFAWGETTTKSNYSWSTYKYCNGSSTTMTKYCNKSSYGYNGYTDSKTVLDLEDDAARANWGGSWRMPTDAEWTELREQCTWTWTTQDGNKGYKVTSKTNGNSIFLPAAGHMEGTALDRAEYDGDYWAASLYTGNPAYSWHKGFSSGNINIYSDIYRYYGLSVRPVYADDITVESVSLSNSSLTMAEGETHQLTATVLPTNATNKNVTWSSSNTSVATVDSTGLVTAVGVGTTMITVMTLSGGCTATCEVTVISEVKVTSVSLSSKTLSLVEGEVRQLVATVLPSNATNKDLVWSSSNTIVATVDSDGIVTAVNAGTATITVTTQDGGYSASCTVSIIGLVDLGLSVKWASCNLGASCPEEYGDYYAWGETETKGDFSWSTYKYCNGSSTTMTKYCTDSSYGYNGFTDNKTVLDLTDDVARAKFGGSWRIPTDAEWTELLEQCTWTWTTQNGVNGYKVTSKTNGNSIFLPAAGYRDDTNLNGVGSSGRYWSSTLSAGSPDDAWFVLFYSSRIFRLNSLRYYGLSIRPVLEI